MPCSPIPQFRETVVFCKGSLSKGSVFKRFCGDMRDSREPRSRGKARRIRHSREMAWKTSVARWRDCKKRRKTPLVALLFIRPLYREQIRNAQSKTLWGHRKTPLSELRNACFYSLENGSKSMCSQGSHFQPSYCPSQAHSPPTTHPPNPFPPRRMLPSRPRPLLLLRPSTLMDASARY